MLNWIVWNRIDYSYKNSYKMDLALNNLQRLICHKTNQPTNQPLVNSSDKINVEIISLVSSRLNYWK